MADVRFAPDSGGRADMLDRLLCANCRHQPQRVYCVFTRQVTIAFLALLGGADKIRLGRPEFHTN